MCVLLLPHPVLTNRDMHIHSISKKAFFTTGGFKIPVKSDAMENSLIDFAVPLHGNISN